VVAGDLLLAAIGHDGSDTPDPSAPPAGWTYLGRVPQGTMTGFYYWKLAGGSEPASYSFAGMITDELIGGLVAYRGVDQTNPLASSRLASSTPTGAPAVHSTSVSGSRG